MISSNKLDFLKSAVKAGDFDKDVIKLLQKLIKDYERQKRQIGIYQQIIEGCNIDAEWEQANGDSVGPLLKELKEANGT